MLQNFVLDPLTVYIIVELAKLYFVVKALTVSKLWHEI